MALQLKKVDRRTPPTPPKRPSSSPPPASPPPAPSQEARARAAAKIATKPVPPAPPRPDKVAPPAYVSSGNEPTAGAATHAPVPPNALPMQDTKPMEELGQSQLIDLDGIENKSAKGGPPITGEQPQGMFEGVPDKQKPDPEATGNEPAHAKPKSVSAPPRPGPKKSSSPPPAPSSREQNGSERQQTMRPPPIQGPGNTPPMGVQPVQRRSVTPQGIPAQHNPQIKTLPPPPSPPQYPRGPQGETGTPVPSTRPSSGGPPPLPPAGQTPRGPMNSSPPPVLVASSIPSAESNGDLDPEEGKRLSDCIKQFAVLEGAHNKSPHEIHLAMVVLAHQNGKLGKGGNDQFLRQQIERHYLTPEFAFKLSKRWEREVEAAAKAAKSDSEMQDAELATKKGESGEEKGNASRWDPDQPLPNNPNQESRSSQDGHRGRFRPTWGFVLLLLFATVFCYESYRSGAASDVIQRLLLPPAAQQR